MTKFTVTVEWVMSKNIEVEALDEKEAYEKAMQCDTSDGEYLEGSYEAYVNEDE